MKQLYFVFFVLFTFKFCVSQNKTPIFTLVDQQHSGIDFQNEIEETLAFNYYQYMHMYMGSGVATGDFNNDGLPDIFFSSNTGSNKLYINQGDFKFRDITEIAKVSGEGGFYTGVTTVDINNDGWLDIYVSCSGPEDRSIQKNLLFVNNKDLTFTESSMAYGLSEHRSHSIQANFFDYDNDGDLDVYIVNTPVKFSLANEVTNVKDIYRNSGNKFYGGADKLYRNNGNQTFTDVTEASGIYPDIFFGLNAAVSDFNNDGWMDIFVSNDFAGPDYLYMNNGDGTFTEKAKTFFSHITNFSMGADVGDVNNDGYQDLFVLDMLPEDYKRSKTSMTMMPRELMYNMVDSGYHWQYMHNVLQINSGMFKEGMPAFSDLAYFSGIENTDWSWSCLLADFDNDGLTDIHVTNGILRDVTNVDSKLKDKSYFNDLKQQRVQATEEHLKTSRGFYPSVKLSNYLFKNNGDFVFEDVSTKENVGPPSFSNGSAYADFDNDGDLDLVCNNVNDNAFLFENLTDRKNSNYIKIKCKGTTMNPFGLGAKVKIVINNEVQVKELHATRGYFSASEPILHFGLGDNKVIDRLEVNWPDGKMQNLSSVKANQTLILDYADAIEVTKEISAIMPIFKDANNRFSERINCTDIPYDDFKEQLLLPHKLSSQGPCAVKGDFNSDGLEDFYVGGAAGFSGTLYLQEASGHFKIKEVSDFNTDKDSEDTAVAVFDANGDGHLDLYVASGSYEMPNNSPLLNDRLYLNDGKSNFTKANKTIPQLTNYASTVVSLDFDNDGDMDIFVGGHVEQGQYPFSASSYLLENNNGKFIDVTKTHGTTFLDLGILTSIVATDFNGDGYTDIIAVGEWMPITFLENNKGIFKNKTTQYGFSDTSGWWNTIIAADIDQDGDMDYVVGNLGLNYKFHASKQKPFHVYGSDFDNTGSMDIVLAKNIDADLFPVRGKMCSSEQMPFINEKFKTFNAFANADLSDIYGSAMLEEALHLEAKEFRSVMIINTKKGFVIEHLPKEAQFSTVNGIVCGDFDLDGINDLLLAGNKYEAEVETSRADAGMGVYLKGKGNADFEYISSKKSGFFVPGNIKSILDIRAGDNTLIVVGENNAVIKGVVNNNKKP
ncbi:VCBS repeat-containing protein [Snuella sedimenti]|uniref:VCBS repeat-containing protein n=1 Tax=Snuella sedimenti TaxID=2798802 RepID=A0A8J7LT14_9FLAO|nr:VCBS repeat-containing protein [Snuella sedimenti]MBJ6367776.1 VCBS repeat-containing protein [Snuella sedimenti]